MSDRELLDRLRDLDGAVEPSVEFRANLRELIDEERESPGDRSDRPQTLTPGPHPMPTTRRRMAVALAAFAGVLVLGLATLWVTSAWEEPADTSPPTTTSHTVVSTTVPAQTDTERVIQLPADRYPTDAAFVGDRFWVIAQTSPPVSGERPATEVYVMGIDAETEAVDVEVMLGNAPSRVAASEDAAWVTHWETGSVSRLDPETGEVVATIPLQLPFDFGGNQDDFLFVPFDIVLGHGSVWVSTARGAVARIDQDSNQLLEMHDLPGNLLIGGLEVGPDGVWVEADGGGLFHILAENGELSTIPRETLGHRGWDVFIPGGEIGDGMFVGGSDEDDTYIVSRVDLDTLEVVGAAEFDRPLVHLGWINGFVGALDDRGVFTHLSAIPRLGSQINRTTWTGGYVFHLDREAWEIDTAGRRLVRVDETGEAAVELPFEIDDGAGGRRPIPDDLAVSSDWESLDPGPLSTSTASAIWTGEELVFWGGDALGRGSARVSGVAYNPGTREWRMLSESPVPNAAEAVWTGEELIVWSGFGMAGAWSPAHNTWRVIEDWPLGVSFDRVAAWTGEAIIDAASGLIVDPADGSSTPIADPPELHERASVVWVDGHLVSVTGEGSYDVAADEWVEMPESPLTPLATAGVAIGDAVFAVDYEMDAAWYDAGKIVWSDLPDVPLRFYECAPNIQAFRGATVVDHCAGLAFWDEVDSMWMPVSHPKPTPEFVPTVIAADDRLFVWGDGLYEFVGDPEQPSRLAVGTSVLDVPQGWMVTSVSGDGEAMQVVVESPDDNSCIVNAIHAGAEGVLQSYVTGEPTATLVDPHVGGELVDALVVEVGEIDDSFHLVWATSSTDVVDVACSTESAAGELAPRIWSPFQ